MSRTDVLDGGAKETASCRDAGTFIDAPGEATHDGRHLGVVVPRPSARASHRPCLSIPCMVEPYP
jgi:hypothetical protein